MKTIALLFISLSFCASVSAQVKIGDNPQNIAATSLLELESSTRALVITRITTAQMDAMVPAQGAVIYNTDTQCLHYFSGTGWINLCEALEEGKTFSANAAVNPIPTIVITETGANLNFEVGQITGNNIVNGSINGDVDIQQGSVTRNNLALNSVGRDQLEDGAVSEADIDLGEVTLGTFVNDAGYITEASIVSVAPGNDITNEAGAFYDDADLQTAIAANTATGSANTTGLAAHIAADGDTSATNELLTSVVVQGNNLVLNEGANQRTVSLAAFNNPGTDDQNLTSATLNGANVLQINIENGTPATVDLSSLAGTGTDDQNLTGATLSAGNVLQINIENGTPATVDLSSLAGTGTDDQQLTLAPGNLLTLENGGTPIDLTSFLNTDDQTITDFSFDDATSILSMTLEGGNTATVDLEALATAGGNPDAVDVTFAPAGNTTSLDVQAAIEELQTEVDGITATGTNPNDELITGFTLTGTSLNIAEGSNIVAPVDLDAVFATDLELSNAISPIDGSETVVNGSGSVTVTGTGTTADPYILTSLDTSDGSETVIDDSATVTVAGTGTSTDPYILSSTGADGSETVVNGSGTVTVTGTGTTANPYVLTSPDTSDGSETVIDDSATVTVAGTGTSADPYVLTSTGGADGSETVVSGSGTVTVTGTGTTADPYVLTSPDTSDGSETVIDDSATVTVAGTGTSTDPYILSSTGADGSETVVSGSGTVTVTGTGTTANPYVLTSPDTSDGSETVIDDSATVTVAGTGTSADPYVLTSTGGADGSETVVSGSGTVTVTGTGTTADPYVLTSLDTSDGSETVIDDSATVTVVGTGTSADPYVLTSTGGADGSETVVSGSGTVTVTGTGTTANPYVLTSPDTSDGSETVIDDSATVTVAGTGTSTDPYILSSTGADGSETVVSGSGTVTVTGTGTTANPYVLTSPDTSDGSETVIDDSATVTVAGTGTSADPYVLTSTGGADGSETVVSGSGTVTVTGTGTTANPYVLTSPDTSDGSETVINDSATVTVTGTGTTADPYELNSANLSNTNLTQTAGQDRTYALNGQNLIFTGLGNVGIGNGANPPDQKFHVAGAIRSEGFLNSVGLEEEPSYRFDSDPNTGMYHIAADQLGFSTGGDEALRIIANQNVGIGINPLEKLHVNGNILAEGDVIAEDIFTNGTLIVPDYVFETYFNGLSNLNKDYRFMNLPEIEAFVKNHNHLPGIESAQEVKESGKWNLTKASLNNLEKIEELFLHTINQEKEIQQLKAANTILSAELEGLKKDLADIKKALVKE